MTGKLDKICEKLFIDIRLKEAQNVLPEKRGTSAVSSTVIPSFSLKAHSRPAVQ